MTNWATYTDYNVVSSPPVHPDKLRGVSDEMYMKQCKQLSDDKLFTVKRQDLAGIILRERKMARAREEQHANNAREESQEQGSSNP